MSDVSRAEFIRLRKSDGVERVGPAPEIVMDANGHYWRRYDDMLSMVPTTTANEDTEVVAVYRRVDPDAPWPSTHSQHGVLLEQIKELHAELESQRPPSEPPKACPTCGSGWTYHHACPDRGSGIDGGTATRRAAR